MKYSEELQKLENAVADDFLKLRKSNEVIHLVSAEDIEDGWYGDGYFDMRSSSGGTKEIQILRVDKHEIYAVLAEDKSEVIPPLGLYDLAGIEDRIALLELLEKKCK